MHALNVSGRGHNRFTAQAFGICCRKVRRCSILLLLGTPVLRCIHPNPLSRMICIVPPLTCRHSCDVSWRDVVSLIMPRLVASTHLGYFEARFYYTVYKFDALYVKKTKTALSSCSANLGENSSPRGAGNHVGTHHRVHFPCQ